MGKRKKALFSQGFRLSSQRAIFYCVTSVTDYLTDNRRRKYLHPEMQAELLFGIEQSKGVSKEGILENFETFLRNDEVWEEVNQDIVAQRKAVTQESFPAMEELRSAVKHEVEYQEKLWQSDYEGALANAERVLGVLDSPELRGYRGLWHYLAGSAAWLGSEAGDTTFASRARIHFGKAKGAATGIPWLVTLSRYEAKEGVDDTTSAGVMEQIERVEIVLSHLGTVHDRSFSKREQAIFEGLKSPDKGPFEEAHRLLGELIGFEAGNEETEGSPDPWWIADGRCFVFEDHQGGQDESILSVKKARQVSSHPNWIRDHVAASADTEIIPVLVTPVAKVTKGAVSHLQDVTLWPLNEFRDWAEAAVATIRELRTTFYEPGDLIWRAQAAELFILRGLDAIGLETQLKKRLAKDHLIQIETKE